LCDYEEKEEIRTLKCNHHFHKECVDQWLAKDARCPLCVQSLIEKKEQNTQQNTQQSVQQNLQQTVQQTNQTIPQTNQITQQPNHEVNNVERLLN